MWRGRGVEGSGVPRPPPNSPVQEQRDLCEEAGGSC